MAVVCADLANRRSPLPRDGGGAASGQNNDGENGGNLHAA